MAWGYNADGQYGWIEEPGTTNPITGVQPSAPSGGGANMIGGAPGGLAQPVSNPGTNGSNSRYFVGPGSGLTRDSDGRLTDGTYHYDDNGLSYDRPDATYDGLPPANESEGYDVYTGSVKRNPGGGFMGGANVAGSNPYFGQMQSSLNSQSAADLANTKAAIQQALIAFGLVPTGFQDKLGALDNLTKDLIAKNTDSGISTYARLLEQKRDNMNNLVRRLTGSGLRRSGTKGYKMRRGQLDWDRLFQDSLSGLLKHTGGLYNNYTNNEFARQQQLINAMAGMNFGGSGSGIGRNSSSGGGFTPIWQGTWAEGVDTGGYVPNSGQLTYQGDLNTQGTQPYDLGNGVVAY